jgi:hypothetical protein
VGGKSLQSPFLCVGIDGRTAHHHAMFILNRKTIGDKTGSGDYGSANDVAVSRPPQRYPVVGWFGELS